MSILPHISVVTPVYGCAQALPELYNRLKNTLSKISDDFEIIMINDASPDDAWDIIKKLAKKDNRVKGINLSRNFGQHYAITAGLDFAQGDWVVVMDCDLQDKPEEISKLYAKAQQGFDIVFGRRSVRQDGLTKKISSAIFYKIYDYFTDSKVDSTVANFSIISSKVSACCRNLKEQNRLYPVFINWLGFNTAYIDIEHEKRKHGKSSYSFRKLWNLAIDGIVSQSNKPLRLSIKFGFMMAFLSAVYAVWLLMRYFLFQNPVEGWTSVMVSIYFVAGLLFANLGFIGLYIGKIFDEAKNRPLYVIKESTFDMDKF